MEERKQEQGQLAEELREEAKRRIASRGVPSSESLYLPPHYGKELRAFQDDEENPTRNLWGLDEVVNFVFPKKYQAKYHETALAFMQFLHERVSVRGSEISEFVKSRGVSKATFYNRVLPRLKRVGMVKVERETMVVDERRKYRPMIVSLSKTFGNYLTKIGDSWLAVVDDARTRKAQKERT
ncbi:MAG: hypothetical protein QXP42_03055 [Candidatus Micrarchaeia archaeon]